MWTPDSRPALQNALLNWYREHARPLPWRTDPSLYRTVVSEFMCQQTQIETVLPYFARWMEKFPDFEALAIAPEPAVLKAWEGLGYYNRARNLHRLAKQLAARADLPKTPHEWKALPGIGPYTAAAVSSINDGFPAAVVDGNVIRILARLAAFPKPLKGAAEATKVFQPLADELLNEQMPGDHNQAMMELGATVCLKRQPLCSACPVRQWCSASQSGEPENFPKLIRRKIEKLTLPRLFLIHKGRLLLERAPSGSKRLANLAELPQADQLPLSARGGLLMTRRRGISNQQITEPIYHGVASTEVDAVVSRSGPRLFWQSLEAIESISLSGPHRRWIRELIDPSNPDRPRVAPARQSELAKSVS